jgi:hypothetical protein
VVFASLRSTNYIPELAGSWNRTMITNHHHCDRSLHFYATHDSPFQKVAADDG